MYHFPLLTISDEPRVETQWHDLFYIRIDSRQEVQWLNGTVYYIGCCWLRTSLEGDTLERDAAEGGCNFHCDDPVRLPPGQTVYLGVTQKSSNDKTRPLAGSGAVGCGLWVFYIGQFQRFELPHARQPAASSHMSLDVHTSIVDSSVKISLRVGDAATSLPNESTTIVSSEGTLARGRHGLWGGEFCRLLSWAGTLTGRHFVS